MAADAAALPRASCFFEDEQRSFEPYDHACRHFAEDPPPPPPQPVRSGCRPEEVLLHVYELKAFDQINRLMATELFPIGGALHVGVEVYGREWSYGGGDNPGAGVRCEVPRSNCSHRFRETLALGRTPLADGEVALIIGELVEAWKPQDYHWLHRNCLAFANELCQRLQVGRIPAWIDRFARGAGVVDLSMRGLAGGLLESVQGVALGAQELVRAIVEGPRSCTSCVPTPNGTVCAVSCEGCSSIPGGLVCTVSCESASASQPWERMCMAQAWSGNAPRRFPAVHSGAEVICEPEPPACAAPPWRSMFEVVTGPDERIAYAAEAEAQLPDVVDPSGEDWLRFEEGSPDREAARLEKWFAIDESRKRDLNAALEAASTASAPMPARKGVAPVARGLAAGCQDKANYTPTPVRDRANYTPTPVRARCRASPASVAAAATT